MRQDTETQGLDGTKPFWMSKTMWGAGLGVAAMVVGVAGYQIDPATQQILIDQSYAAAVAVFALGSTVLTVVGRFKASQAVTAKKG